MRHKRFEAIFDNKFLIRFLFMEKVNFIEIAKYCQEQSQIKHSTPRNSYCNTLFVSIQKDNKIECSCTPHIS